MLTSDSVPEPDKFEVDGYEVAAWGADRHGTLEFALQRSEGRGLTRFAILDATPLEDGDRPLMVQVFAGAEQGDRFTRQLVREQATSRLDYAQFEGWFEDARTRANELRDQDLTQIRPVVYDS